LLEVAADIALAPAASARHLQPLAGGIGVAIEIGPCDAALQVRADRTRLKQVLANLLSNGVKYNRRGGRVELRVCGGKRRITIDVVDDGAGIAEKDAKALFEPFNRLAQRHSGIEGTGIGLALSRALVRAMGGDIAVRSRPGAGSTFSVELPRAGDANPQR
jgi:hypothetical protein